MLCKHIIIDLHVKDTLKSQLAFKIELFWGHSSKLKRVRVIPLTSYNVVHILPHCSVVHS